MDHAVLVAAILAVGLLAKKSAVVVAPLVLALLLVRTNDATDAMDWVSSRRVSLVSLAAVLASFSAWRAWLRLTGRDDVPLVLVHRGG